MPELELSATPITKLERPGGMTTTEIAADVSKVTFGFWVYLMTDCVLFAALFATFVVLRHNTFGGPTGHDLFSLPYILMETLALLTSSYTCGLAVLAARRLDKSQVLGWLSLTGLLGATFLTMELSEFTKLVRDGDGWQRSGFLSSYFTLVGTHGLHITIGIIWMVVMISRVTQKGLTPSHLKHLTLFSLFWHFLDIVWIFIFTVVYLTGVVRP